MTNTYLTVSGRIRREHVEIDHIVDRALDIWDAHTHDAEPYHLDAVALNLHGFYSGIERIFEIIATQVDEMVPSGGNWHQELLEQMNTNVPNLRPIVITNEVRGMLEPYRGFRHVVRNVYTLHFDERQIDALLERLPEVTKAVVRDLEAFADHLESVASR